MLKKKVIDWRRDFHEHPELSNREFKTAEKVAKHLRSLGGTSTSFLIQAFLLQKNRKYLEGIINN